MPRPTAAQITYGSITVIFSTLAMLLLSQTSSAVGTAVIAVSALALGLLVAMTVPQPKPRVVAVSRPAEHLAEHPAEEPVPAVATGSKTAA
ncbi:hypothetical protein OG426_21620 [Streptomyces canus]|uniref:hypothetical protein n=1 Tax=Streptomyces canus TaxID=58343 RepID=UPI00225A0C57|nr:hypothetical protein [Streptomyces canus]MCX4859890.1 hypothetical protein [Streptomyces canus]WSW34896.1 hypothetical protein OG426_21620 [Streptomyces canus]